MPRKKGSSGKRSARKKEKKEEVGKEANAVAESEEKTSKGKGKRSAMEIEPIKDIDAIEKEDEYAIAMLGWATSGYDITKLEELMKGRSKKRFEKEFEKVRKGIEKLEKIKKALENLNISGVEKEVDELLKVINDPYKAKEAEKQFETIKKIVRAKDIESELDSMLSVEDLRPRVMEIKERLKNIDELDKIEEDLKDLRREFKESYFVAEFIEMIEEKPRTVKKIKVTEEEHKSKNPMMLKDLFVFSNTGKFLGHKTTRKGKIDKKELVEKLNTARDFVKNDRFSSGVLIKVPKGDETLLVQKGEFVAVGMIISGEVHRLTGKLLKKGIEMMEKEDEEAIRNWDGSKESLLHLQKNMNAIMYAAIKLGEQMEEK